MMAPVTASGRGLLALAGIISKDRPGLPEDGLPESLLADLMGQIRCVEVCFAGMDSAQRTGWSGQEVPFTGTPGWEDLERLHWKHYRDCQPCSHPDRTGGLRSAGLPRRPERAVALAGLLRVVLAGLGEVFMEGHGLLPGRRGRLVGGGGSRPSR
jgi:hypothetical protein